MNKTKKPQGPLMVPIAEVQKVISELVNRSLQQIDIIELRNTLHRMAYRKLPPDKRGKGYGKRGRPLIILRPADVDYIVAQHARGRMSLRRAASFLRVGKATAKDIITNPEKYKGRIGKAGKVVKGGTGGNEGATGTTGTAAEDSSTIGGQEI